MSAFIIIITILHSYVFAVMFFTKKKLSSTMLGLYMLSFFIQASLIANFYYFHVPWLYKTFYLFISALTVLYFPLVYLYVKILVEESFKWRIKYFIHFVPACTFLVLQMILYLNLSHDARMLLYMDREIIAEHESLQTFFGLYGFTLLFLLIQIIAYSISMVIKLLKHRKNIEKQYSYKHKISLNWLFVFVMIYLAYYVIEIVIFSLDYLSISEQLYFSIISIHIFFVGIWGLRQKDIYTKEPSIVKVKAFDPKLTESIDKISEEKGEEKIKEVVETEEKRDLLPEGIKTELAEKIMQIITEEKLFLNPEFSLNELAEHLNIHKNYISFVINDVFKKNFYTFINEFRVDEAKKMLSDPEFNNLSIEGIATSCGYKSRNVFYPIFKKYTGLTPVEYKKKYQI